MRRSSRRRFLQGVALCGVAGGVSGCLGDSSIPGLEAEYAEWLPAPATISHTDRYRVRSFDPAAIDEQSALLGDAVYQQLRTHSNGGRQHLDIDRGSLDAVYDLGSFATVLSGEFDASEIETRLERQGWEGSYSDGAFRQLSAPETDLVAAVAPEAVVLAPAAPGGDHPFVHPVLATYRDENDHYTETDEILGNLAEALGDGDVIVLQDDGEGVPIESVHAVGSSWRLTDDVAKTTIGIVFADSSAVDEQAIETLTERPGFEAYEGVSVGQRGRVGIVSATVPTVSIDEVAPLPAFESCLSPAPAVRFEFVHSAGNRTVTITHDGGTPVPVSRLTVEGEGFAPRAGAEQTAPGQWRGETSTDGIVVDGGDQVTVGVTDDPQLRVRYHPMRNVSPVVLAEGPEPSTS